MSIDMETFENAAEAHDIMHPGACMINYEVVIRNLVLPTIVSEMSLAERVKQIHSM